MVCVFMCVCVQVHSSCKEQMGKACPLGQCRVSIIPPTTLNSIDSDGEIHTPHFLSLFLIPAHTNEDGGFVQTLSSSSSCFSLLTFPPLEVARKGKRPILRNNPDASVTEMCLKR